MRNNSIRTQPDAADSVRETSSQHREAMILRHLDQVRITARNLHRRVPPCVTLDDLMSAGTVGLIKAADRFDHTRDVAFSTYARHKIWGAMLDFLREEDPLSRTARRKTEGTVTVSLDSVAATVLEDRRESVGRAPFAHAVHDELRDARRSLPAREDRVLTMLYDLGWNNREVAAELGVNESRISQIKSKALSRLRARFGAAA